MEFWSQSTIDKIEIWKQNKSTILILVGPIGCGKTTVAKQILGGNPRIFRPTDYHQSNKFLREFTETLNYKSVLMMMSGKSKKGIMLENIDHITSSEKAILKFLGNIYKPHHPIVATAHKMEKRHREMKRGMTLINIEFNINK